jgi:hypothetical protein
MKLPRRKFLHLTAGAAALDCHVTSRGGHAHATEGMISCFDRAVCRYFTVGDS